MVKKIQYLPLIRLATLACLFSLLTACSGNIAVEDFFAPDPKLQEKAKLTKPEKTEPKQAQLPEQFPQQIPRYPKANFTKQQKQEEFTKTTWISEDSEAEILDFYQQQFIKQEWELLDSVTTDKTLRARKGDLEVKVTVASAAPVTELVLAYKKYQSITPTNPPEPITSSTAKPPISDEETVPEQLRQYVADLKTLGAIESNSESPNFSLNQSISKGKYARWLITANNKIYADSLDKQIRLATSNSQPAFDDLAVDDRDFGAIQGLAEAGIIPSRLTGDNNEVLFRPDAPLTRAELILWKVPLDIRQPLPSASLEKLNETWGFQDSSQIAPELIPALIADFQNEEQANVRRAFGYTTLLQPQKVVTHAEAAAAIWYFGYQGKGRSAVEIVQPKPTEPEDKATSLPVTAD